MSDDSHHDTRHEPNRHPRRPRVVEHRGHSLPCATAVRLVQLVVNGSLKSGARSCFRETSSAGQWNTWSYPSPKSESKAFLKPCLELCCGSAFAPALLLELNAVKKRLKAWSATEPRTK